MNAMIKLQIFFSFHSSAENECRDATRGARVLMQVNELRDGWWWVESMFDGNFKIFTIYLISKLMNYISRLFIVYIIRKFIVLSKILILLKFRVYKNRDRLCMEQFFIDEKFLWECVINHSKFCHFLFLSTISSNNTFRNKAIKR